MDPPSRADRDVLALPLRAELFASLAALCRPATTQELAKRIGRHHNTVRKQLQRLADAGLVERRTVAQARGRPRDWWAISATAAPGGLPPDGHGQLSRWLARAIAGRGDLAGIEATGREIGRELVEGTDERPAAENLFDALAALGFVPRAEPRAPSGVRFVLRNCPYREAVLQNQPAICGLHRGITQGLLDRLSPHARLAAFVAKHPLEAGCLIEVTPMH
jgi:predicted ArsR family transcriptional regulator